MVLRTGWPIGAHLSVLEVQENDDKEEENDDRSGVDHDLQHADKLRSQHHEKHRERQHRDDQTERGIDRALRVEHDTGR